MSIVFVAPVANGSTPVKKALRGSIKKAGKAFAVMMKSGEESGDHLLVTEDIPAGQYDFTVTDDPNGMVQIDLTPGTAP